MNIAPSLLHSPGIFRGLFDARTNDVSGEVAVPVAALSPMAASVA